jgi:drug/metabolite transporter (DMT)-like permease
LGSCLPATLLYYVFYYGGTAVLPASQAFVINYLWPIMSVIFACLLLRERVTPIKIVGILLSFAGLIVAIANELVSFDTGMLFGALLCVLGAISYGAFTALSRKAGYDSSVSMMISYFATFLITGVWLLATNDLPQIGWGQLGGLVWNGAVTMGIANTVWVLALSGKDTARISNLAYITPVLSMLWLAILLDEDISVYTIVGLGVILLGVLVPLVWEKWQARGKHHTADEVDN